MKTRFHALLDYKIQEEIKVQEETISSGQCQSFDAYRDQVGYIRGLKDALKLAEEVETEMQ